MYREYIFLAEIKGSDFPGRAISLSPSRKTTNPVMPTQCSVPSVPPAVRPLRFGTGFGCKIVRVFPEKALSLFLPARSVHCQSRCNDRPQKLLRGSKRDCPQENLLSAESGHCAPPPAPAGTGGHVWHSQICIYTHART